MTTTTNHILPPGGPFQAVVDGKPTGLAGCTRYQDCTTADRCLRALMKKHELTQREVAELACVSIKTVESWLADAESSNHRNMPARNMRAIRFALPAHLAAKRGRKA